MLVSYPFISWSEWTLSPIRLKCIKSFKREKLDSDILYNTVNQPARTKRYLVNAVLQKFITSSSDFHASERGDVP